MCDKSENDSAGCCQDYYDFSVVYIDVFPLQYRLLLLKKN